MTLYPSRRLPPMTWKPSPEPTRYDRERVARLRPLTEAVARLRLPLIRQRKLNGILNALEMQIEDGGDSSEVNQHLVAALRAALLHQVTEREARPALKALDAFAQSEAQRWEQVRAGMLPPIVLTPEEELDELMQEGYALLEARQQIPAVDCWLEVWERVKRMATPVMRTAEDFDAAYPMLQSVFNWCSDLEMELHNAGLDDPAYFTHLIRYVDEFLAQFPAEDALRYVNMLRAKGEALWGLGRQAEAEAVYQDLITRYPDEGWAYIGWADQYYLFEKSLKAYEPAEALLLQALARPPLNDRGDVLDRLIGLYEEWGKPRQQARTRVELDKWRKQQAPAVRSAPSFESARALLGLENPKTPPPLRRNDPCWCGSGKKYKHCHMHSDQAGKR
ncbi:MAG: SEC-C domain-containing protein [Anaerolineae bacterium]|nr:SEC-C domain-containing protein [Anaerolineae bacterium]